MSDDGSVQVAPDSTGKKVDTSELTRKDDPTFAGAGTIVERQRVALGGAHRADDVLNSLEQGRLPVSDSPVMRVLVDIRRELRVLNFMIAGQCNERYQDLLKTVVDSEKE